MKTRIQQPKQESRTIQSKTKAANQASIAEVLQKYRDKTVQRETLPEEDELLQGKFETAQRADFDEEEPLQGKLETVQREEFEEEPLQGKFADSETVQREAAPNRTGLPDNLKSGIEATSGYSMDDVRVHYNSPKPAQLQALAYTQGTDIHVAPGQEKHLPHEAWHVVQQKQGRVQPTMQLQGVNINDNEGLEKEADVMGEKSKRNVEFNKQVILKRSSNSSIQLVTAIYGGCFGESGDPGCTEENMQKWPKIYKTFNESVQDRKNPIFNCAEPNAFSNFLAKQGQITKYMLENIKFRNSRWYYPNGYYRIIEPCETCRQWMWKNEPIRTWFVNKIFPDNKDTLDIGGLDSYKK
jgi:hypothetical protein